MSKSLLTSGIHNNTAKHANPNTPFAMTVLGFKKQKALIAYET